MAKILIVDDSADLREVLSLIVQRRGHDVASVSCKQELFNKLPDIKPDVLVLDVRLGGEDGRKLCKEIKTNYPAIPVILFSGSPELLNNYTACDADDIIEKPFDITLMLNKIEALSGRKVQLS